MKKDPAAIADELPGLPPVEGDMMSQEIPAADPELAVAALEAADPNEKAPGGDAGEGEGDGPTGRGTAPSTTPDPANPPPAPSSKQKKQPPKATPRARGDARLTKSQLKDLRKDEALALLEDRDQQLHAAREKIEDLAGQVQVASSVKGEFISESITEAVAATIDVVGNFAAQQWGSACNATSADHAKLDLPWTRVAKLYLGQHAEYSPLAAALLATVSVAADKYVAVKPGGTGEIRLAK